MDRLTDARNVLFAALSPTLPLGRWSAHPPSSVVAPCGWIETSAASFQSSGNAQILVATFPVVVVADGDVKVQSVSLDQLIATTYDALRKVGTVVGWSPNSIDVGGPSLRSARIEVSIPITARTLCDPPIITT